MKSDRLMLRKLFSAAALSMFIMACGGGGDGSSGGATSMAKTYRVSLTNITHNQPLSPPAVIIHTDGYTAWRIGETASDALEMLAEGGDPSDLISAASADSNVLASVAGSGAIGPGAEDSLDVDISTSGPVRISVATMLVNTNDAFSGIEDQSLDTLDVGQSISFLVPAYDAGTEANSEDAVSVPGPAGGGEGFNATRDDIDSISVHPGVVSAQDGFNGSALDGSHRWDNPVVKLTITRTG